MGNVRKSALQCDVRDPALVRFGQQCERARQPQFVYAGGKRYSRRLHQALEIARRDLLPASYRGHGQVRFVEALCDVTEGGMEAGGCDGGQAIFAEGALRAEHERCEVMNVAHHGAAELRRVERMLVMQRVHVADEQLQRLDSMRQ